MAPHSSGSAGLGFGIIEARRLGNTTHVAPQITFSEERTLQILALTFATISVASSILAFYWFMKMRRSFRHDLIMLLIQSDMFKALWFMIYPIVIFTHGPIADSSTFCQVSGFFLSVGIESSDIAVLMIAVHSALFIFRRNSSGEGGLYPYRHFAYAIWVLFPILVSSLAFINNRNAYVAEGTYCYLPVRPFWYRLALSWIPRYIIFVVILAIYLSIYYYVKYKQYGFDEVANKPSTPARTERHYRRLRHITVPPTPALACHGLIPDSQNPSPSANETEDRRTFDATLARYKPTRSKSNAGAHMFMLASMIAGGNDPTTPPSEPSSLDTDSFVGPSTPQPLPRTVAISPQQHASVENDTLTDSRATSWRDGFIRKFQPRLSGPSSKHSFIDIFTILRNHPDGSSTQTPLSQLQLINSRGQTFVEAEMLSTREKVRKQLRFLFIYPLVYIGMWILPFVSHVLQYDDRFAINPPFGLLCITTISICSQAAVDSWLFSIREMPWHEIPGTNGGFWESLKFWTGWKGHGKRRVVAGPGKTREEMDREARAAYQRRDVELAQRRIEVDSPGPFSPQGRRAERSWWDVDRAGTSPLAEETSNPMDNVGARDEEFHSDGGTTLKATTTSVSKEAGSEKRP